MQRDVTEERQAPRWQIDALECKLFIGGKWVLAAVANLSLTGVQVSVDHAAETECDEPTIKAVVLIDPSSPPPNRVLLESSVAWWDSSKRTGGLKFINIDAETAQHYHALLAPHIIGEVRSK